MSASDQKVQVVLTGRLVLNQDQQEVDSQRHEHFLLSTLIDRAEIGHTIPAYVIAADHINQADE